MLFYSLIFVLNTWTVAKQLLGYIWRVTSDIKISAVMWKKNTRFWRHYLHTWSMLSNVFSCRDILQIGSGVLLNPQCNWRYNLNFISDFSILQLQNEVGRSCFFIEAVVSIPHTSSWTCRIPRELRLLLPLEPRWPRLHGRERPILH